MSYQQAIEEVPLPEGWRWLQIGEKTRFDDVLHDKRAKPVKIEWGGIAIFDGHHPMRRKIEPPDPIRDAMRELSESCQHPHLAFMHPFSKRGCDRCLREVLER